MCIWGGGKSVRLSPTDSKYNTALNHCKALKYSIIALLRAIFALKLSILYKENEAAQNLAFHGKLVNKHFPIRRIRWGSDHNPFNVVAFRGSAAVPCMNKIDVFPKKTWRTKHLHPRAGRDAEEGDGEHGRSVWEQSAGLIRWNYDYSGRFARIFCFLDC